MKIVFTLKMAQALAMIEILRDLSSLVVSSLSDESGIATERFNEIVYALGVGNFCFAAFA